MHSLITYLASLFGISREPQSAVAQAQWQRGYNEREEEAALSTVVIRPYGEPALRES